MSDEGNTTQSVENESDSIIVLVENSGHTEDVAIGGSSAADHEDQPLLETSDQTAGEDNTVSSRREKWEIIGKKTYAEIAAACPGSKEENFSLFGHNPPEAHEDQNPATNGDPDQVQAEQVRDQGPEGTVNQGYDHPIERQIENPLQEPFTTEEHSTEEDNALGHNPQEQVRKAS